MRFLVLALGAVMLSGCMEDEALVYCEKAVKNELRSPSTYKRIEANDYSTVKGEASYYIKFDASNAYGTPIRGLASCKGRVFKGDKVRPFEYLEVSVNGNELSKDAIKILNATLRVL